MTVQEIMARISYDVDRLRYSGMYERDLTIILTHDLFKGICLEYFETDVVMPGMKMFGVPVRILKENGREWFVSVVHGIAPKEGN